MKLLIFTTLIVAFQFFPDPDPCNALPLQDDLMEEAAPPAADHSAPVQPASDSACSKDTVVAAYGRLPLYIIKNQGQLDKRVHYYVPGSDKTLFFSPEGLTIALTSMEGVKNDNTENLNEQWALKLDFLGADPDVKPEGKSRHKAVFNYFRGEAEDWKSGVPTYSRLVYRDLWPGIDLAYSASVNQVKYELVVHPGADPDMIRFRYRGAKEVVLKETGELLVSTPISYFEDGRPSAFQGAEERKAEVNVRFKLDKDREHGYYTYGFDLGPYDINKTLIIDPVLLVYCGYIGGDDFDSCTDIAVDSAGYAYVVGTTASSSLTFPVKTGPYLQINGNGIVNGLTDAFVAKVDANGTQLLYCGYIGGKLEDKGAGIAVDDNGCAYVTGLAESTHWHKFPFKVGPYTAHSGKYDAFVAKVSADGTQLIYCGYIGGDEYDEGFDIAVDNAGCAYVTGSTESDEDWNPFLSFPLITGPDLTFNSLTVDDPDAFVAKVKADGTGLVYSGYIGGEGSDTGTGIAVDSQGCAYATGYTESTQSSFPVNAFPYLTHSGSSDAYVAKVKADGTGLIYCGYVGGESGDAGRDIDVDSQGSAYITGETASTETSFPVKNGPELVYTSGNHTIFVAKVKADGLDLDYCGYINGENYQWGRDIAVDRQGNAYVTGETCSDETSFPVLVGPYLTYSGSFDAFVARISADGMTLNYCGYIGGSGIDNGLGIDVDRFCNAYIAGFTLSSESSFPVTVGPGLYHNGGEEDGFVTKVAAALATDTDTVPMAGGTVNFDLNAGAANGDRDYILLGSVSGTSPGTPLPGGYVTLPLNWDYFTDFVNNNANGPIFPNFQSKVNQYGWSWAQYNPGPFPPGSVGLTLYFAYALNKPWNFVSNPVAIVVVP